MLIDIPQALQSALSSGKLLLAPSLEEAFAGILTHAA